MARHLSQVIRVDEEKCVNCHACIAVCPVKVCNNGSGDFVNVNPDGCIGCGRCLSACQHQARHFTDDLEVFLQAAAQQRRLIAIVAPSVVSNFPEHYLNLNGWLRQLGVEAVFDVSFGAELTARSYAEHLQREPQRMLIAQPCPAVVSYIQIYQPELIEYLAPIDSPMLHTIKAVRQFFPQYAEHEVVALSPCPAKRREFDETGLGNYNVTFAAVERYLRSQGLSLDDFAKRRFQNPTPDEAMFFPLPGGLMKSLERWRPDIHNVTRRIEGQQSVYEYLATLPELLRQGKTQLPVLVDCLNCRHGCSCGPGSVEQKPGPDAVEALLKQRYHLLQTQTQHDTATNQQAEPCPLDAYWMPEAFSRRYANLAKNNTVRLPSDEQRDAILRAMHKQDEEDLRDCCSCGYGSCEMMTVAIHNQLNRPENCHHYLIRELELSKDELSHYRDHLANLVSERTLELTAANEQLRCEVLERKRAEQALLDSEQKVKDILHGSPIAQFVIDKDHRVIYWNQAMEQLSGLKVDEMVGTTEHWKAFYDRKRSCLSDMLVDGDLAGLDRLYQEKCSKSALLEGTYEVTDFFPHLAPGGKWLRFIAVTIKNSQGAVVGAAEALEDITERKRAQDQLAESQRAAEAANRAKSEFLANMSHEIRTPMTAIMGFADLIGNGCPGTCSFGKGELVGHVETITRNSTHLLRIINDILDLTKIEARKFDICRADCPTIQIINDVANLLQEQATAKGLQLHVEYDGPMPAEIHTDPIRLRQILINLVGNAIKFTETGVVRLVVRFRRDTKTETYLDIKIIDTGVGITAPGMARLFRPFSQVDTSSTRRFGGTGLGLTISRRLAELLGGKISVISERGKGSTFTVTIAAGPRAGKKLIENPAQIATASKPTAKIPSLELPSLDCRILLAEDGPDNRRLICFLLEKAGAEVTWADNGRSAVELALTSRENGTPFDVILMDMQMPKMDGYDATRALRNADWQGPIIALTAHAMTGDRQKCLDAGCDDYLPKPINRRDLMQIVAQNSEETSLPTS